MIEHGHLPTSKIDTSAPGLWKVEVIADNSGIWCSNGCVYPNQERAEAYAEGLACRWTAVREWRVVEAG